MKQLFFLLFFFAVQAIGAAPQALNVQPIHEAFISRNRGLTPLEVIGRQPPAPIAETPPPQQNAQTIWIPGYWYWLRDKQDFVWICGVWRLPPSERVWSSGYWKNVQGGWTWITGAWMTDPAKTPWLYSKEPPPSPQNENVGNPPSKDYYWFSGYWEFVPSTGKFQWLSGSWQKFNSGLILEPAHWIWRPEGYLFVSTYWDWSIETRGQAYDCTSHAILTAPMIAQQLIYCYPDYLYVCSYYWFYYPHYWNGCGCIPPWWGWADWWSIPSDGHWWLWWWWSHPGFPAPFWLPGDVIIILPPPAGIFIDFFGGFPMPWFITPFGVPEFEMWLESIGPGNPPLLTPPERIRIIDTFPGRFPPSNTSRPGGTPGGTPPSGVIKPTPHGYTTPPGGRAVLPTLPTIPPLNIAPPATVAPIPVAPTPMQPTAPATVTPYYPPQTDTYVPPQTYYPETQPNYPPTYNTPATYYPPEVHIWRGTPNGWDDGNRRDDDQGHHGGHDRTPDRNPVTPVWPNTQDSGRGTYLPNNQDGDNHGSHGSHGHGSRQGNTTQGK